MLYGSVGRVGLRALLGSVAYTPLSLFAAGEQGVWLDNSDFTTLFQDAAGTTPVTGYEQFVGLRLDKSKGLVLGPELVRNGTFDSGTTDWTKVAGTTNPLSWDSSGKRLIVTNDLAYFAGATQTLSGLTIGKSYLVAATISNNTVDARVQISGLVGASSAIFPPGGGNARFVFAATATSHVVVLQNNQNTLNGVSYWDNVSVRELPGNHAYQTTTTARPVLSARVNLLTYTEQFDDGVWAGAGSTITANTVAAPNGTQTADTLTRAATGAVEARRRYTTSQVASVEYTLSCYAKAGSSGAKLNLRNIAVDDTATSGVVQFDLSAGTVSTTYGSTYSGKAFITSAGNGWWHCRITGTTAASLAGRNLIDIATSDGASAIGGTSGEFIYIWGADLRVANESSALPAYQRIGAAVNGTSTSIGTPDYDTVGFPAYLRYDGGDWYQTGSIDFTSTDKMSVFAGVRKLSDTAPNIIAELSASVVSNSGAFAISNYNPNTGATSDLYNFISRGSVYPTTAPFVSGYASPVTSINTGLGNISGDSAILRVNGLQVAADIGDQGTGTFGNYPLYLGARGGSTSFFTGRDYGFVIVGRAVTAAELANTENYMEAQTFGKDMQYVYADELTTSLGELITAADGDQIYMQVSYV